MICLGVPRWKWGKGIDDCMQEERKLMGDKCVFGGKERGRGEKEEDADIRLTEVEIQESRM